jgi:hypothetical protein
MTREKKRMTVNERYKSRGLQQFSVWLPPETILRIKLTSNLEGITIGELIQSRFKDLEIERTPATVKDRKGKIIVRFTPVIEEETEIS